MSLCLRRFWLYYDDIIDCFIYNYGCLIRINFKIIFILILNENKIFIFLFFYISFFKFIVLMFVFHLGEWR